MAFNQTGDLENNTAFKTIFGTEKPATPLMPGLDDCMGAKGEETWKAVQWLDVVPLPNRSHKKQVMAILLCHNKKGIECLVTLHLIHSHDVEKTAHDCMYPSARHWETTARDKPLERHDFLAMTDCTLFFDKLTDQSNKDKADRINALNNLSLTLFDLSPCKKTTEALHVMPDGLNDGSACFQRTANIRRDVMGDEDVVIEKACSVLEPFNETAVALNDNRDNNALETHHVTGVS